MLLIKQKIQELDLFSKRITLNLLKPVNKKIPMKMIKFKRIRKNSLSFLNPFNLKKLMQKITLKKKKNQLLLEMKAKDLT